MLKRQFKTQKEQYTKPIIIILSSLPQAIVSLLYACNKLKQSWQRYTLLTTYFLSYLPQILGFILYILPSTIYSEEFHQKKVGKRLMRQQNTKTNSRLTKRTVPTVLLSYIPTRELTDEHFKESSWTYRRTHTLVNCIFSL
jgi:hypothetical protein